MRDARDPLGEMFLQAAWLAEMHARDDPRVLWEGAGKYRPPPRPTGTPPDDGLERDAFLPGVAQLPGLSPDEAQAHREAAEHTSRGRWECGQEPPGRGRPPVAWAGFRSSCHRRQTRR